MNRFISTVLVVAAMSLLLSIIINNAGKQEEPQETHWGYETLNFKRISRSTVFLHATHPTSRKTRPVGSGVVVEMMGGKQYVFTAAHLFTRLKPAPDFNEIVFEINDLNDVDNLNTGHCKLKFMPSAEYNNKYDFAILELVKSKRPLHPAIMLWGKLEDIGTDVVSSGNPSFYEPFHPVLSDGIISRHVNTPGKINSVTDTEIFFGSSGGGIFKKDTSGHVTDKPICLGIINLVRHSKWCFFTSGYRIQEWMVKHHPDIWLEMNKRRSTK